MKCVFIPFDYKRVNCHFPTIDIMLTSIIAGADYYVAEMFNDLKEDEPKDTSLLVSQQQLAEASIDSLYRCCTDQMYDMLMGECFLVGARAVGNSTCLILKDGSEDCNE